jgi:acyl-coenzyme A synthetase/AMP-(fatty) acid ligase
MPKSAYGKIVRREIRDQLATPDASPQPVAGMS